MASKKTTTLIYVGIGAALIYWFWKKKPIVMPAIVKVSPGIPTGGALTTPGGQVIEAGNIQNAPTAPPDTNYSPAPFNPDPVDVAPVDPIYLTDFATKSNESGTPPDPYFYPNNIFQDDLFLPPAPTDPFSVNTLPATGLQQLTPSYATIKDMTNPNYNTLDYDCPGCSKTALSGYTRPVPNIC